MPGKTQTPPKPPPSSFIPHDAAQAPHAARKSGSGLADLFFLVSIVLLVASGAMSVGVFLYHQYLQSSVVSKSDQLERASAAFEPTLIKELTQLDDRMHVAGEVLGRHIAPSVFFRMLEQSTIQTTSFRALNFEASDKENIIIKMNGIADSVNAIAFQADLFSKIGVITSPIFTNIDRRADGVHFDLSANLSPAALNYVALVRQISQNPTPSAPTQTLPESAADPSPFDAAPEDQ